MLLSVAQLGAGRCLSGIHCALLGAARVILTDADAGVLRDAESIVRLNGLDSSSSTIASSSSASSSSSSSQPAAPTTVAAAAAASVVSVERLAWGEFSPRTAELRGAVDLLIGADVFYDGRDFEDVFATVSYFDVPFLTAYQHRGEGLRRFRLLSRKWNFNMRRIPASEWEFDPELLQHEERRVGAIAEAFPRRDDTASSSSAAALSSLPSTRSASSSLHEHVSLELLLFTPQQRPVVHSSCST